MLRLGRRFIKPRCVKLAPRVEQIHNAYRPASVRELGGVGRLLRFNQQ